MSDCLQVGSHICGPRSCLEPNHLLDVLLSEIFVQVKLLIEKLGISLFNQLISAPTQELI